MHMLRHEPQLSADELRQRALPVLLGDRHDFDPPPLQPAFEDGEGGVVARRSTPRCRPGARGTSSSPASTYSDVSHPGGDPLGDHDRRESSHWANRDDLGVMRQLGL